MRSAFRIQRSAPAAFVIHLSREEIRQHGAKYENPADHGYSKECVEKVFHGLCALAKSRGAATRLYRNRFAEGAARYTPDRPGSEAFDKASALEFGQNRQCMGIH